ncbi:hypothetical protein KEM09_19795 [Carboxylicivirga mesophila]|uniref:DUF1616 domain-containing protein n=1 Tax=Carboxylicivirga mesophila TaxID=1166478 RepID=A0ABS5KFT5_9BACT|nr:hypothetical protein [Carboxylicivirga mesophila]MBS2213662.1 hypothetical protein [Carboxylicivirga mesophila]
MIKKLEILFAITAIASLIMRLMLINYWALLSILSFFGLAFLYFPIWGFSIFNLKYKNTPIVDDKKNLKAIMVIGGIAFSILCTGIAFKLIHIPSSTINLSIGLVSTSIVILIITLNPKLRGLYRNIIMRGALLIGLALTLLIVPEIVRTKIQYKDHPEFIDLYEQSLSNPEDEELKEIVDLERHRITMNEEEFKAYQKFRQELKENNKTLDNTAQ